MTQKNLPLSVDTNIRSPEIAFEHLFWLKRD